MNTHRWISIVLLGLLLIGCGQTGPLYLPDENRPVEKQK